VTLLRIRGKTEQGSFRNSSPVSYICTGSRIPSLRVGYCRIREIGVRVLTAWLSPHFESRSSVDLRHSLLLCTALLSAVLTTTPRSFNQPVTETKLDYNQLLTVTHGRAHMLSSRSVTDLLLLRTKVPKVLVHQYQCSASTRPSSRPLVPKDSIQAKASDASIHIQFKKATRSSGLSFKYYIATKGTPECIHIRSTSVPMPFYSPALRMALADHNNRCSIISSKNTRLKYKTIHNATLSSVP